MADKVVRVELTGGSEGFKKAFADAAKASNDLGKALGSVSSQIEGQFKSMGASIGGVGEALSALGPAGLGAAAGLGAVATALGGVIAFVVDATKGLVEFGGHLSDLAEQTGLSLATLQELRFAGKLVGVSMEDAAAGVNKMQKAITAGDDVFERLGLNLQKLRQLNPGQQFEEVAARIREIKDPTQQAAAAMEAFGKSGAQLLPLIKSDLAAAREEAHNLGIVLGDETLKNADALGDQADKLAFAWEGFKNQIAAVVVDSGVLTTALQEITSLLSAMLKPLAENKDALALLFREGVNEINGFVTNLSIAVQAISGFSGGKLFAGFADNLKTIQQAAKEFADFQERVRKRDEANAPKPGRNFVSSEDVKKAKDLQDALAKVAEEEKKAAIEANKRAAAEEKAVEKVNEQVRQRLSQASVSIFGTSKEAARDAELAFQDLQTVLEGAKKTINDLSEDELLSLEQKLKAINAATGGADVGIQKQLAAVRLLLDTKFDDPDRFAKPIEKAIKPSVDWRNELQQISQIIQSFPGGLGKIGQTVSGVAAGIAGIGSALKSAGGLSGLFRNLKGQGGLEGILGGLGSVGSLASAAIGIGKSIAGLFKSDPVKKAQKEAGKALGHGISKEMAEQFLQEAKATGKTIAQVAKEWASKVKAEQDKANLDTLRAGVDIAKGGAEQLLGLMDKLSPKAQAAGGALVKAVADAMAANGLGVLATGELAKSDQFKAVQEAVGASGQVFQGLRQAGGISTDLLKNGGDFAEALRQQAVEAAKAAGLSDTEAQKAGLAAIAPLLRDQLEASIQSGQKLSTQTQQLIDEAKANGIEIVADPMIALLAESKDQTALLRKIAGEGGAPSNAAGARGAVPESFQGGSGGFRNFGLGTPAILHGLEAVIRPQDLTPPPLTADLSGGSFQGWNDALERGFGSGASVSLGGVTVVVNGAPNMTPAQFQAAVEAATSRAFKNQSREVTDAARRALR